MTVSRASRPFFRSRLRFGRLGGSASREPVELPERSLVRMIAGDRDSVKHTGLSGERKRLY